MGWRFIRKNPTLASAILLPTVMVVFFAAAEILPQQFGEAPKYDLLLAEMHGGQHGNSYTVRSENGHVVTEFMTHVQNQKFYGNDSVMHVYRIHTDTMKPEEIIFSAPKVPENEADDKWHAFAVPELANLELSQKDTAPDGYHYQWGTGSSNNGMLLFSGGYRMEGIIDRDGRRLRVPQIGSQTWQAPVFLGWIITDNRSAK